MTNSSTANHIIEENLKEGSEAWRLESPALNREIEGYASRTSVNIGQKIDLFVNTKSNYFSVSVFRMGWYNSKGGRLVKQIAELKGSEQQIPLPDSDTGLVECDWQVSCQLEIGLDWVSGVYLASKG